MAEIPDWIAWIDKEDVKQHEWACRYLNKKGFVDLQEQPFPALVTPYSSLISLSRQIEHRPKFVELMRKAWAQDKHRKGRGKISVNLVLSSKAKSELDKLAKVGGRNIAETLELLITDQKAREDEHRTKRKEEREAFNRRYGKLRQATNEILGQLDACLLEVSELTVKQEGVPLEQQENRVQELHGKKKIEVAGSAALMTARLLRLMNTFYPGTDYKLTPDEPVPGDGHMGLA